MRTSRQKDTSPEKTKAKIIQAARKVLLKKGNTASTSITDVCAAARITRPTLYHYFKSSRKLFLALHVASMDRDLKPYLEKATSIDDPEERLRFMVRTYMKECICVYPELKVLIHDSLSTNDKQFREVRTVWKKHYTVLASTIEQIQSNGKISAEIKPSWAALFLLGMLTWTTYWFDFSKKDSIDAITDLAETLAFNALALKR